jgi:hypothetical protein
MKRKVLRHDVFGLCVLLPKTHWSKMPPPGKAFFAAVAGKRTRLRVASEACNCRGDKPHEHRFLVLPRSSNARRGESIVIDLVEMPVR